MKTIQNVLVLYLFDSKTKPKYHQITQL